MKVLGCVASGLIACVTAIGAQTEPPASALRQAVSSAEIEKTLDAFDLDRTSGREGERRAAEYLAKKLTEYGVAHTVHETRLYMSWPVSADILVPGSPPLTIKGAAPAFGASTPPGGLTADVVFLPTNQPPGPEVRGKSSWEELAACRRTGPLHCNVREPWG